MSFIKISEEDLSNHLDDNNCLDTIGFSSPDMKEKMDSFLTINESRGENDMIFIFVTGHSIKIHSEGVFLEAY